LDMPSNRVPDPKNLSGQGTLEAIFDSEFRY